MIIFRISVIFNTLNIYSDIMATKMWPSITQSGLKILEQALIQYDWRNMGSRQTQLVFEDTRIMYLFSYLVAFMLQIQLIETEDPFIDFVRNKSQGFLKNLK